MTSNENRWLNTRRTSGDDYDASYVRRAAAGENVHGEVDFIQGFNPQSVLDAGCGTGRVARELARRGIEVCGVDIDPGMLGTAQQKAPDLDWRLGDLAMIDAGRRFDLAVMAGNVMIFVTPGTETVVIANMARHLNAGGYLIAGFQLQPAGLSIEHYDELAAEAGLSLVERWSTWDREAYVAGGSYAVSVHQKPAEG
ncbi:MAG: class I SAM-dependent methyltransferase [Dehalococcoidia bacterium]|nr:class I SAM-dependent methyltransferase [Dehalococcoidia bacterium]